MSKPLVSAVITSYKRPGYLVQRAVESVVNQTYQNIELIVVDDNRGEGSEKYSAEIKKICDMYPLTLMKTENGKHGGQAARNTGIHHAKGEYVAFLDDDDEWLPTKIEKQVEALEARPDAGMCFCRGMRVNENFDPPYINDFHGKGYRPEVTRKDLLKADCIGTTTQAMIRKIVLDEIGGFDERFPARQDYEMWINITGKYPAISVDEQLFKYHITKGLESIARNGNKCVEGYKLLYEKYASDIESSAEAKFNIIFHIAHFTFATGEKGKGILLYIKAFFVSPLLFWDKGIIKLGQIKEKKAAQKIDKAKGMKKDE